MIAIELPQLRTIVHLSGTPEPHPVFELLLDAAIEDAAHGGIEGVQKLWTRNSGRRMTRSELERARQRAADVGRMGEALMNGHFAAERTAGRIEEYEWTTNDNAIAPYDFSVRSGERRKIEVKSTCGDFGQIMHISMAELIEMQGDVPYDLYRMYALDEHTSKLRICPDMKQFADGVLQHLNALPRGVSCDSISVRPDSIAFGPEIVITVVPPEDEPFTLEG